MSFAPPGEPSHRARFHIHWTECERLIEWGAWLPKGETTATDRNLIECLSDPKEGIVVQLRPAEARLVRMWYDHISQYVVGAGDEAFAEKLDLYLDDV